MKINLVSWPPMRLFRILLGMAALAQAFIEKEGSYGLLGIFLLSTAILNVGYCGPNGWATGSRKISEQPGALNGKEKPGK